MNSLTEGALRLYADDDQLLLDRGVRLISEYFHAVKHAPADIRQLSLHLVQVLKRSLPRAEAA